MKRAQIMILTVVTLLVTAWTPSLPLACAQTMIGVGALAVGVYGKTLPVRIISRPDSPVGLTNANAAAGAIEGASGLYWVTTVWLKNIGTNSIVAMELEWTLGNAFDEPIDRMTVTATMPLAPGEGFPDPTKTYPQCCGPQSYVWKKPLPQDGNTASTVQLRLLRVKFSDGSVWVAK